jgi:gamma-glutamyltranspeptidase/glutathione hydrolase
MASVFRSIAKDGKDGFYKGRVAEAIVQVVKDRDGVMTLEDLASHTTKFVDTVTIETDQGVKLHELPPNGHGIVALIAAGIIKQLDRKGVIDLKSMEHNSVEYLHLIIETLKFAFKDGEEYITDIDKLDYNVEDLLTDAYLAERARLFDPTKANPDFDHGVINPKYRSDTVYFTASDSEGNACSFINSLYQGFGSGVIPKGCGFCLQNRGSNFNLTPGTRNSLEGGKRPYHTIIPAAITNADGSLLATYGVMGGFMQPQGHLQVLYNLSLFGFNPQSALDAPRICLDADPESEDNGLGADSPVSTATTIVSVEQGVDPEVIEELKKLGHKVVVPASHQGFGRGQVIKKTVSNGKLVWSAGSDMRADGCALPQI